MKDTVKALKEDLSRNNVLGTVNDWRGGSRNASLQDYDSKNRLLPQGQLMGHLQQSLKKSEEG